MSGGTELAEDFLPDKSGCAGDEDVHARECAARDFSLQGIADSNHEVPLPATDGVIHFAFRAILQGVNLALIRTAPSKPERGDCSNYTPTKLCRTYDKIW